jgi:glycerophosphoryl diester phosphodiesterase
MELRKTPGQRPAQQPTPSRDSGRNERNYLRQAFEDGDPLVFAHRGNHEHTADHDAENTIGSLVRAARDGASDAVEVDFQRLGDGTIVAFHDDTVRAGAGIAQFDIPLASLTLEQLRGLHPKVPTIDQWARRAGTLDIDVMAELKGAGYEREVLEALERYVPKHRLAAMSFDADAVRAVHALDPDMPVGLVPTRGADDPTPQQQVADLGFRPDFVEIADGDINERVLSWMDARGVEVLVGKDSTAEQRRLFRDERISGILTNTPTTAADARDG